VLWLLAVVKRAVRGEGIGTAMGEATGFLWLAVGASAFTPVVLYGGVKLTDSVTAAIGSGTQQATGTFPRRVRVVARSREAVRRADHDHLRVLARHDRGAVLWVELLIRSAMLYVGAVLAAPIYSGLVDRELWGHVRRWAGLMIAVDMVKPVIVIVLSLSTAISSTGPQDAFGSVLSGLAIIFCPSSRAR